MGMERWIEERSGDNAKDSLYIGYQTRESRWGENEDEAPTEGRFYSRAP